MEENYEKQHVLGRVTYLVSEGVTGRRETGADGGVGVLGDLLVGLLGSGGGGTLDGLGDVVSGVLDCVERKHRRIEGDG